MDAASEDKKRERGRRAEDVGLWYLRLNGVLTIPGFLVHWDRLSSHPRTEADALGVRFPHSQESTSDSPFRDDPRIVDLCDKRILFLIVEIKAGTCKVNGPWSDRSKDNMPYVIRRMGFCETESQVVAVSTKLYDHARWEDEHHVVQYLCIGDRADSTLGRQFNHLCQITFKEIAKFLLDRFATFPEKVPQESLALYWRGFGQEFAKGFIGARRIRDERSAHEALQRYVSTGKCF